MAPSTSVPEIVRAVVLNGPPRSGKSTIAREIQSTLDGPWMNLGVDLVMAATPERYHPGIGLRPGGERPNLEAFVASSYSALFAAVAAHCHEGINVVVDVGIHDSYRSSLGIFGVLARRLDGIEALLVGVRCPIDRILERRAADDTDRYERSAGDGSVPAAVERWQAAVHDPGDYDLDVDTAVESTAATVRRIAARLDRFPQPSALDRLRATWRTAPQ